MQVMTLIIVIAALVVLALLAVGAGVDSRDGNDWSVHPR
jgi:hypothetical protein